jgi:NAD(P)-dependent dehydrogenase (short-subunit alcohol dehydrogenase family)
MTAPYRPGLAEGTDLRSDKEGLVDLHGKVAVVTGASSGIGAATARRLAREGMTVVAAARRRDRLEALAASEPRIRAVPTDVTVLAEVSALAGRVAEELGACHALVNNAGVPSRQWLRGPADLAHLEHVMDVNFFGAARCSAALADLLFASAPAQVVNVASTAGKMGIGPPAYYASKFALVGFSEGLGLDWEGRGVVVTQLNPGLVRTEGFPQTKWMQGPARHLIARPEQVADAIVDVLRKRRRERTVPRWYGAFTVLRHVLPPVFWAGVRRSPLRPRGG